MKLVGRRLLAVGGFDCCTLEHTAARYKTLASTVPSNHSLSSLGKVPPSCPSGYPFVATSLSVRRRWQRAVRSFPGDFSRQKRKRKPIWVSRGLFANMLNVPNEVEPNVAPGAAN